MTFYGISRRIATYIVQDRAFNERRYILHKSDLTEKDKNDIKYYSRLVRAVLTEGDGKPWEETLNRIGEFGTSTFHIGFKEQERIISACAENGIKFVK